MRAPGIRSEASIRLDAAHGAHIGPMDLSRSYGLTFPDLKNADFLGAIDKVLAAADKWKKPVGMYTFSNNVQWAIEKGFTVITVDNADKFPHAGCENGLKDSHRVRRISAIDSVY
jgi:2-keto-3-deoxy-L-rhamnonate aldolase RhmA